MRSSIGPAGINLATFAKFKMQVFSVLSTSFRGLLFILKPLTPISPNNINTIANRQVIRIKKNIYKEIVSWSNAKFSKLTSQELYGR